MPVYGIMMKVLLAHNAYQQTGGEDSVFESEKDLLNRYGNQVDLAVTTNEHIKSPIKMLQSALQASWSSKGFDLILEAIERFNPDVVHVHNFFPLLTPSIYDACLEAGVPVVQTLHNYRTICPGALLMRSGRICEKCITGSSYQAVLGRCYREAILGSLAVARMVDYHRKKGTWQYKVDRFIALTQFGKQKFVEAGFPKSKIVVKPNFCGVGKLRDERRKRGGALFVGRLSVEKGVATMLSAWCGLDIELRVVGDGPLFDHCRGKPMSTVDFLGRLSSEHVSQEMEQASFLVMPSEWYEGFPMVLVEAFSFGLPIVASRLGSMAEIVEDRLTGLLFEPGDPKDLAQKVQWMHAHPAECLKMGENARQVYEDKYTPEKNYEILMDVYKQAIAEKKSAG